MKKRLTFLCVWFCTVGGEFLSQTPSDLDAVVWVHNLGERVGEEWPIFLFDGGTRRLAPPGTRVQLFARAVGSDTAFEPVRLLLVLQTSISTFDLFEPGLFDGNLGSD